MTDSPQILFVDFETYYDSKEKYTLSKMSMTEYIRDPRFEVFGVGHMFQGGHAVWTKADTLIAGVDWKNTIVVGHNIKFDGSILAWRYGVDPFAWLDTKALSKAVLGNKVQSHSLANLSNYYQLESKGILKTDGLKTLTREQERELSEYCLHDVELCAQIFERLVEHFPKNQLAMIDWASRCFINPLLTIDTERANQIHIDEAKRREAFFQKPGLDKKIFSSNPKFVKLLSEKGYDIPVKKSPRTGENIPALALGDEGFLDMLNSSNPELRELCEARVAAKSNLLETRSLKLANIGKTGAWPFDVEFSGAEQTHRFSGAKGAGGNPQNFPRESEIRSCITAPKGYKLVVGDFSKIEFVIVSYLAGEKNFISAIENNEDIYCDFASKFYGRKITKNDSNERRFGKTAILGLGYGMGAVKFAKSTRLQTGQIISPQDAKKAVMLYRNYYSAIPSYWNKLDNVLERLCSGRFEQITPFLKTEGLYNIILPSGLILKYPNLMKEGKGFSYLAFRSGTKQAESISLYGGKLLENISQALAGEICKLAISGLEELGYRVVGMVHDEILMVVKEDEAEQAAEDMKHVMSVSPKWWPDITLDSEVGIGSNWKEAKA